MDFIAIMKGRPGWFPGLESASGLDYSQVPLFKSAIRLHPAFVPWKNTTRAEVPA